jgi:hypothetical protein
MMTICGKMRARSVLGLASLAAAATLSGCVIDASSGGCVTSPTVDSEWSITDASGNALSCAQAGATTVNVYIDGVLADSIPCEAGFGSTAVFSGTHTAQAKLVASNGAVLSQVDPLNVRVLNCGATALPLISFEVSPTCAPGAVKAEWTVEANGASVSCTQAGAAEVDITVDDTTMVASFSCDAHTGTTPTITGGVSHTISVSLLDSGGNVLSQTQSMGQSIPCGTVVDIGNVPLSITP